MKTVSFTDLKDCDIRLGDITKVQKDSEAYSFAVSQMKYIIADVVNIKQYYLVLGKHLVHLKNSDGWVEALGYETFDDAVSTNTGLDKSAISRCINVYFEFAKVDDGKRIPEVKEEYEKFSYSQLCELLPLDNDKRKLVTPDMSIKGIRDFKKSLQEKQEENGQTVATSQLKSDVCLTRDSLLRRVSLCIWKHMKDIIGSNVAFSLSEQNAKEIILHVVEAGSSDLPAGKYRLVLQKVKE